MTLNNKKQQEDCCVALAEGHFTNYLDCLIHELDFEKRLLQEIGGSFLPLLLEFLNPNKKKLLIKLDSKHYETLVERFIPIVENMYKSRCQHEEVLARLVAYIKPFEAIGFHKITEGTKQ